MAVAELAAAWKQVVPSLLTVREIRDLLGCSRSTVYRWIDRGLVERVGSIHAPEDYNFQKVVLLAITHDELKARIRDAVHEQSERGEQPLFLSQRLAVAVLANLPEVALQEDGDEDTPRGVLLEEFSKLLTKLCEESVARNSLIADFEEAAKSIFRNRELEAETAELEDMMRSLRDVKEHEAELEELAEPSDYLDLDVDDEVVASSLTVEEDEADAALLATVPFDDTEDADLNREDRFADLESEFEAPGDTNLPAQNSDQDLELGAFPEDDLVARLLDCRDAELETPNDASRNNVADDGDGQQQSPDEVAVDLLELEDDESDIDVDSALDAIWQYENSKHKGSQDDEPEETELEVVDVESSLEDDEIESESDGLQQDDPAGEQPSTGEHELASIDVDSPLDFDTDEIELGEVFLDLDTDFELGDATVFVPEPADEAARESDEASLVEATNTAEALEIEPETPAEIDMLAESDSLAEAESDEVEAIDELQSDDTEDRDVDGSGDDLEQPASDEAALLADEVAFAVSDSAEVVSESAESDSTEPADDAISIGTQVPAEDAAMRDADVPLEREDFDDSGDNNDSGDAQVVAADVIEAAAAESVTEDAAAEDAAIEATTSTDTAAKAEPRSELTESSVDEVAAPEEPRIDYEAITDRSIDRLVSGLEAIAEPARRIANHGQAVVERLGAIEGSGERTHDAVVELGRQVGRIADREEQQSEAVRDDSQSPAAPLLYSVGLFLLALSWSMALLFRGRTTPTIFALLVASNVFACLALWFGWRSGRRVIEFPSHGSAKNKTNKTAKPGKKRAEDATADGSASDSSTKDGAKTEVSADVPNPAA